MDEAVSRRNDFDSALDSFVGPLGELEVKCEGLQDRGESKPAHIQERVEAIRVSESDCVFERKEKGWEWRLSTDPSSGG